MVITKLETNLMECALKPSAGGALVCPSEPVGLPSGRERDPIGGEEWGRGSAVGSAGDVLIGTPIMSQSCAESAPTPVICSVF